MGRRLGGVGGWTDLAVARVEQLMAAPLREFMDAAPVVAFVKDRAGRYLYANPYLLSIFGERMGTDWYGKSDLEIWPDEVAVRLRANDAAVLRDGDFQVFSQVMPLTSGSHRLLILKFLLPAEDGRVNLAGIGVDLTERHAAAAEREQLASAVEQAAESVMIADLDARITYVNPAFERVTGYSRAEVIGQNPRILASGRQSSSFYQAMWAALTAGLPWTADFVNRRKDGSLFTEESVITPILDGAGLITSYVAVKRDVTRERALVEHASQLAQERALIAETIRGLGARGTPEATAQAICRQVMSLTGVTSAQLFLFELDGGAMPVGFVVAGQPDPPLRRLPAKRSRHLQERAADGPWIEPWVNRPGHPYNHLLTGLGVHSVAYAPVRHDQRLIGVLVIDAQDGVTEAALSEAVPALVEFADLAGALIGRTVDERAEVSNRRELIKTIIADHAFQPVFQPIVDIERDVVVGYEALTRFADGVPPDIRFAEAAAIGLDEELELATLRAALAAAEALPGPAWLNLNVSPALIMAGAALRTLVDGSRRHLVLEVTEHTQVGNYPALLAAMTRLGPAVEFAIDDAGAGFASLRHILELKPAFVKLDRWLIADLETDEARQAMIVGLRHFARATGCRLIAEGIETEDELAILRALDIRLGQGHLLGWPGPLQPGAAAGP
jgi:PAS domain S-box-containing protein